MIEKLYNNNWKFWVDHNSFALIWDIPDEARDITLPHDAMIEKPAEANSRNAGNTGYRDGEVYNYVKIMYAPQAYKEKTLFLKFEGIYMNSFVYINGQLAGKNPFGYSGFYVSLNEFLNYGEENEIRIQVRNGAMTNSRWYSGGGIYRDVYLLESDLAYITPESIFIKTENADENIAVLHLKAELKNRHYNSKDMILETTILDHHGETAAKEQIPVFLFEQESREIIQRIAIKKPKLWSDQTPTLYTCIHKLYSGDTILDEGETTFGIRTLQLDAQRGLQVNGKTIKLRGACIHHDSGLLGAATYEDAQYRQVKLLKDAGFNAIRMSHHPMAPAMLRACDQIGMYVMDETFDMWNRCKSDYDYGLYFQEWWRKDVSAMVCKNYNHPSVILYSVGNEIPEIGTNQGVQICHTICEKIKSMDDTRYTLASINGVFASGDQMDQILNDVVSGLGIKSDNTDQQMEGNVNDFMTLMDQHMDDIVIHPIITKRLEKACSVTDIAGYNYMSARYEKDGLSYPNRVIVGSETYPPEIARNWDLVKKLNHVIGDFTWTGWDYIGETGVGIPAYEIGEGGFSAVYPAQLAYVGDFDITGVRRPASFYREIVFGLRKDPYITIQNPHHYGKTLMKTPWIISDSISNWTWEGCEGKPVVVEIYSPGTEVELYLNKKSLGRKKAGAEAGYRTLFDTIYQPGTLTAISYDDSGAEIGRMKLQTADSEEHIVMIQENHPMKELVYIAITLCDQNGNIIVNQDQKLELYVEGGGTAIGFGSGNPKPAYHFNEGVTKTYQGRAQIILKREDKSPITVTVSSEHGNTAELTIGERGKKNENY